MLPSFAIFSPSFAIVRHRPSSIVSDVLLQEARRALFPLSYVANSNPAYVWGSHFCRRFLLVVCGLCVGCHTVVSLTRLCHTVVCGWFLCGVWLCVVVCVVVCVWLCVWLCVVLVVLCVGCVVCCVCDGEQTQCLRPATLVHCLNSSVGRALD